MVAQAKPLPAASVAAGSEDIVSEMRQLISDLRDAAQDGRHLAQRYAEILQNVVDEYCVEFEKRAEAALAKLEAVQ
jgi:signal transduction histidine kinase